MPPLHRSVSALAVRHAQPRRLLRRVIVIAGMLLALLHARSAAAQPLDPSAMESKLDDYFSAERSLGLGGMIAGAVSLGGAALLYTREDDFFKGAAYPVAGFGLLELAAGAVIFFRTPGQLRELKTQLGRDPVGFRRDELARMQGVNDQFDVLTIVWIAGIVAGLGTATYGLIDESPTTQGVGAGVALQSAIFLTADLIASKNARDYTGSLERFAPGGSSSAPLLMTLGGRF